MFIERPDERFRTRMHARHDAMTVHALMMIFRFTQSDAESAVAQMMGELPAQIRDRAGHEDPTSLAARIAGKSPTDLTKEPYIDLVKRYDLEVRPNFELEALDDYNTHIKPKYDKLKYGG